MTVVSWEEWEEWEQAEILAKRLAPTRGWDLWEESDLSADRLTYIERMPRQRLGCGLTLAGIPNEESVFFIDDIPHVRCDCGDLHRLVGGVLAGLLARVGEQKAEAEARRKVAEWARRRRAEEERDNAALPREADKAAAKLAEQQAKREAREREQADRDRLDLNKIAQELLAAYPVPDLDSPPGGITPTVIRRPALPRRLALFVRDVWDLRPFPDEAPLFVLQLMIACTIVGGLFMLAGLVFD